MLDKIEELKNKAKDFSISSKEHIEEFRLKYLSKKGELNDLFDAFKLIAGAEKKEVGRQLNILRQSIETKYNESKEKFSETNAEENILDTSLPVGSYEIGTNHPISLVRNEILSIFERIGFTTESGPEIEDDWHNFSALNFPENHPARDMQDTFFVEKEPLGNFNGKRKTTYSRTDARKGIQE
jgi:phenylalanyl-tRNA synthetase alpha chain